MINIYNIMFIHGQSKLSPASFLECRFFVIRFSLSALLVERGLRDLGGGVHFRFFSDISYQFNHAIFSLNDVQHGLLRSGKMCMRICHTSTPCLTLLALLVPCCFQFQDPIRGRRWKGQLRANRAIESSKKWDLALKKVDCRIHFVLFGGLVSRTWLRFIVPCLFHIYACHIHQKSIISSSKDFLSFFFFFSTCTQKAKWRACPID